MSIDDLKRELADALHAEERATDRLRSAEYALATFEEEVEALKAEARDPEWNERATDKLDRLRAEVEEVERAAERARRRRQEIEEELAAVDRMAVHRVHAERW
jgi:chromosome segregation ATPase